MELKEMFCLEGKVAVVTGGGGHLGVAMCEVLAEYGATVVLASRDIEENQTLAEQIAQKYSNCTVAKMLDVSNEKKIDAFFSSVQEEFGGINILINNAYFGGAASKLHETEYIEWQKTLRGTVDSSFLCSKAAINIMMEQAQGSIVNIGSMYGMVPPHTEIYEFPCEAYYNPVAYGVGKSGLIHLTKYIAVAYAAYGIRCNCISPGPFPSAPVQENREFIQRLENQVPLKRIGTPDDLKGAILLLASDAASYISGQNIVVDGGWTVW